MRLALNNLGPRAIRRLRRTWFDLRHRTRPPHDLLCQLGPARIVVNSQSALAAGLYTKSFEESERALLEKMTAPGGVVVDIGANVGLYSVLLSQWVGRTGLVYAFEPYGPVFKYLTGNLLLNGLPQARAIASAVTDVDGTVDFWVYDEGLDAYNSLGAKCRPAEGLSATRSVRVPATTLDSFFANAGVERLDVMKIDVEGAEERVIRGALGTIRRNPAIRVLLELYEPSAVQNGCSTKRLVELLTNEGFCCFEVHDGGALTPTANPTTMSVLFARPPFKA